MDTLFWLALAIPGLIPLLFHWACCVCLGRGSVEVLLKVELSLPTPGF